MKLTLGTRFSPGRGYGVYTIVAFDGDGGVFARREATGDVRHFSAAEMRKVREAPRQNELFTENQ